MKLGLSIGGGHGAHFSLNMELIAEAENLGFDSLWTSESWGHDAITPAAWALARTSKIKVGTGIIQMTTRTPTMTAMSAITLQQMSGGRFILGLGPSGPQVVEGWHGVPYGKPLTRLREYVSIVRTILERKGPLVHEGEHYSFPYKGDGGTGLGIPLKSILHGDPSMRMVTGAISPAGVKAAAEIVDGFIPIYMDPTRFDVFEPHIQAGFDKAGKGRTLADFDVMPMCYINVNDDVEAASRPVRENLALYIGGMGARDKNFYCDYAKRIGFEEAATKIQNLFLDGKRGEAAEAVPQALIDQCALVGSKARIVEKLSDWKAAAKQRHVDTLIARTGSPEALQVLAEAVL
ncbi:MAG: LLM class F420-dependent oxidoreductase [Alphaproteobacteria bacterium]|jgi:F420-dependent oxidoreductase-like protein|nr:LLM class F420-dependent oxidoreductase [Alphaproteobacteria bacterium]